MKDVVKIIGLFALLLGVLTGLSYGFGWIGVHQTKTIGKAQQNAERVVFEETQGYVEGKRQEALKLYKEYRNATDEEKASIKEIVSLSFANFDEKKLSSKLQKFVSDCKYR